MVIVLPSPVLPGGGQGAGQGRPEGGGWQVVQPPVRAAGSPGVPQPAQFPPHALRSVPLESFAGMPVLLEGEGAKVIDRRGGRSERRKMREREEEGQVRLH